MHDFDTRHHSLNNNGGILTFSGSCDLFSQSGDDTTSCIMLVQSMRQLCRVKEMFNVFGN